MTNAQIGFPARAPGRMHAGGMDSERVRRTYLALLAAKLRGWRMTTAELDDATGGRNAHSDVAALRANGFIVRCKYKRRSQNGAKVYEYWLG